MELKEIPVPKAEGDQLIIGQSHFIKTIEDLYEAVATSAPGVKFGVAFSEASGKALVRKDGTDEAAAGRAAEAALAIAAGHCFVVVLVNSFPINVLERIKRVDEVTGIYCATSNPVTAIVADTGAGRAILGVVDGVKPKGIEGPEDLAERKEFLRKIGYKR